MKEIIDTVVIYKSDFKRVLANISEPTDEHINTIIGGLRTTEYMGKIEDTTVTGLEIVLGWKQEDKINTMTHMKLALLIKNTEINYIIKE